MDGVVVQPLLTGNTSNLLVESVRLGSRRARRTPHRQYRVCAYFDSFVSTRNTLP